VEHSDDNLIADLIAYYRNLDGRILTIAEAELYADSLADWYDCLVDIIRDGVPLSSLPGTLRSGVNPVQQRGTGSAASSLELGEDVPP
jgi:hypothetical protein